MEVFLSWKFFLSPESTRRERKRGEFKGWCTWKILECFPQWETLVKALRFISFFAPPQFSCLPEKDDIKVNYSHQSFTKVKGASGIQSPILRVWNDDDSWKSEEEEAETTTRRRGGRKDTLLVWPKMFLLQVTPGHLQVRFAEQKCQRLGRKKNTKKNSSLENYKLKGQ